MSDVRIEPLGQMPGFRDLATFHKELLDRIGRDMGIPPHLLDPARPSKTAEEAFLEAIIENPADDVPRLIYSDWLEENDRQARAEFIRAQCYLCGYLGLDRAEKHQRGDYIGEPPDGKLTWCDQEGEYACCWPAKGKLKETWCKFHRATHREREIMGTDAFLKWCPSVILDNVNTSKYRRGFIAEFHCTLAAWQQHGHAIVRAQPVEMLRIVGMKPAQEMLESTAEAPAKQVFCWWREGHGRRPEAMLPLWLWRVVEPIEYTLGGRLVTFKDYPTPEEAVAHLGRACLAWAKAMKPR